MIKGHKIKSIIIIGYFLDMIKQFNENDIHTTKHTFFRLKEGQRKIFI